MKKFLALLLALAMVLALVACGAKTEAPVVAPTTGNTETTPAAPQDTPTEPAETPEDTASADPNVLPRNETLYFAGQQWGTVNSWNIIGTN
jgi:peptide/nickel transport system substrate-binding protein